MQFVHPQDKRYRERVQKKSGDFRKEAKKLLFFNNIFKDTIDFLEFRAILSLFKMYLSLHSVTDCRKKDTL